MPSQGDIVLIPIPFSDLTSSKRRPAIVVSNDEYHRKYADMIVVAMTSNPQSHPYGFTIDTSDLVNGALNRPSKVRVDKVFALSQNIVAKVFGKVQERELDQIRLLLADLVIRT